MGKKIIVSFFVCFILLIGTFSSSNVNKAQAKQAEKVVKVTEWKYLSKTYVGVEKKGSKRLVAQTKATRTGETLQAGSSSEYTNTISASLGAQLNKTISAQVGYSFSTTKGRSISKTSAPIKKGETVKAYEQEQVQKTKVTLSRLVYTTTQCKVEYKTVYTTKEIAPDIIFEYGKK